MPYMFGAFDAARPYGEEDRAISARMLRYWANFARSGDPNGADLPAWPQSLDSAVFMELGDGWAPMAPLDDVKRTFLEGALMGEGAFQF
jgi:carboxylesterase type B